MLAAALALVAPATAHAGVIKGWPSVQPYGTVGTNVPIVVLADATRDGYLMDASTIKVFVDGVLVPRSSYYGSNRGGTGIYIYYAPILPDGLRTFRVEIKDTAGKLSFYQWSATIAQAPNATWTTPAANATLYSGRFPIGLSISDNTPASLMTVSGAVRTGSSTGPVVATFGGSGLSAGSRSFTLANELPPGTYHLTATVTDAVGNIKPLTGSAARTATLVAAAPMSVPTATCLKSGCHVKTGHPSAGTTCTKCHIVDYHGEYSNDCSDSGCHEPHATPTTTVTGMFGPCQTCHDVRNPSVPGHTAASVGAAHASSCDGCHNESLLARHGMAPDGSVYSYQCDTCHESTRPAVVAAIRYGNTTCEACHTADHVSAHDIVMPASCGGSGCHSGTNLSPIHADNCAGCHDSVDAEVVAAIAANNTDCAACHTTPGVDYHLGFEVLHTNSGMAASCQAAGCHSNALVTAHQAFVGTGNRYPEYANTCALCHANASATRIPAAATADCLSCHPSADHEALHEVTLAAECVDCHQDTNLLTFHDALGCSVCHQSANPVVVGAIAANDKSCAACHGTEPHGDLTVLHTATVTNGPVDVFSGNHEGIGSVTWDVPCTLCHASTNLLTAHANDCSACHSGAKPANSFTTWNGGCTQGTCHAGLEHSGDYAHNSYVNTNCDICHEPSFEVIYPTCDWCHNPSSAAPVTTSDVKATYTGAATIGFSSSNFSFTFSRLDGAARVGGTTLLVPPPATGSQTHTVEYWSVTDGGIEELPHKTATFTVTADNQAPTTTSNALASYIGPATIALTPTDNGSTPVSRTYWKINGGDQQSGRTVTVPQPASGQQTYTLEYWSVDASGNEELPHPTKTFTITSDTTAPVGSISIAGGAAYTIVWYPQITLSASDAGGSGVYQMRFSNDNVTWSEWESYATTKNYWYLSSGWGPKTVYVQFKDRAGNVSSYSDGIYWDPSSPSGSIAINGGAATAASTSVVINNNVIDAHSGMATMRFSNDYNTWSAWEPFAATKAWTLTATTGTKTVYAQFRDNAGNGAQYTDTITLAYSDSVPPTGSVVIAGGAEFTTTPAITLNLTAVDTGGSGLSQMQFSNDGVSWSTWETYAASKSWTLVSGDGQKTVSARFRDMSGNVSLIYSDTITLDGTLPTGTISVDGGAANTADAEVTLALSASDLGSGLSQMQFSNDGSAWSGWESYATSRDWTLTAGDGIKTVYVRYRDTAGNQSVAYSDTITFGTPETIPPTGSVVINGGAVSTPTSAVTLTLPAADTGGSGLTQMRFSNDGTSWSTWESYATTKSWTLAAGVGVQTVYVQYRDAAGNVSTSYSDTISVSAPQIATLAFVWHPPAWGEAHVKVTDSVGTVLVDTWLNGTGSDLDLSVPVASGQNYYMECVYYYDEYYDDEGGPYGVWTNNPAINADGILSPGETVIWNY